jgi:hypothetical protein
MPKRRQFSNISNTGAGRYSFRKLKITFWMPVVPLVGGAKRGKFVEKVMKTRENSFRNPLTLLLLTQSGFKLTQKSINFGKLWGRCGGCCCHFE